MSNQTIIGIGKNNNDLWTRDTPTSPWTLVSNSGKVLNATVMPNGTIVGIGLDNVLWTRATLTSPWVQVPNSGKVIAVAALPDGQILGVGMANDLWTRATLTSPWVQVPNSGAVIDVTVMPDGTIVGIGMANDLWTRATLTSPWVQVPNSGAVIGVTAMRDGSIIGIGMANDLWTRATLHSPWVQIPNSGSVIGITTLPATPTLQIVSGNNQTVARVMTANGIAQARFAPMSVVLKDAAGQLMEHQPVTWSVMARPVQMAVQMEGAGGGVSIIATSSNGVATLDKMGGSSVIAYYADGAFTVHATAAGATAIFNATVSGLAPPDVTASIQSGNNQTVARGSDGIARFAPLAVKVVHPDGTPASGVRVGFGVGSRPQQMIVQMTPAGAGATTVTTDASGVAILNGMAGYSLSCYGASGALTIVASPDGGNQVTFSLTVSS